MNKLKITLVFCGLLMIASANAEDRFNITSNTLGHFIGFFNLELSYKISDHWTLGLTNADGKTKSGDIELSGYTTGIITRRYFSPAFDKNSWYLVASADKRNLFANTTDINKTYSGVYKDWVYSAGAGYHWFWDSFNISFGLLGSNQTPLKLKDSNGNEYKDQMNPSLGIDFTIGGKF